MLRATLPTDTDALCDIAARTGVFYDHEIVTFREVLSDYHESEQSHGHVCQTWEDGQVQGLVYYAPIEMTDRTWEIWWIVVDPKTQGQGIGKKLMRSVEDDIRNRGGRLLLVETSSLPRYQPTTSFYKKLGYIEAARIPDFYTAGDDKIVFWKQLSPIIVEK